MGPKTRALVIVAVAISLGLGGCGLPPDLLTGPDPFDSMRRRENVDAEAAAAHRDKWEQQTQLASVEDLEDLGLAKEQELSHRRDKKTTTPEAHAELSKLVETMRTGLDSAALDAEHQLKRLAIEQGLPVADYVVQLVRNRKRHVRLMAIGLVGRFGEKGTFPELIVRLLDPELQVRNVAFAGLKRLADRHYGLSPYDYVLGSDGRIQQQGAKLIEQLYAYNPYASKKERIHKANAWLTWYREDMRGKGLPRRFDDQAPVDVVVTRPKSLDIYMKDPDLKVPTVKMFGVRSGSLIFTELLEDAKFKKPEGGRLLIGIYYRYPFGATGQQVLEVGVDTGSNTDDITNEELFIFRTNYLYYPWLPAKWYLSAGVGYALEIYNDADEETSTFLEAALGFAVNLAGQDWDLRGGYWSFQDSENVQEMVMLSVALRF